MRGVKITPWRRGKLSRLYVKDANSNETIGWVETDTYTGNLEIQERAVEFVAALFNYGIPREASFKIVRQSAENNNVDLAVNAPGKAAHEKAIELTRGMDHSHAQIVKSLGYSSVDQTWFQGAAGEELVGTNLEEGLGSDWHVIHSVPIGTHGADIDHLIIGPGGVYSVNTKTHPGSKITCAENTVKIEGSVLAKNQPYARNSRFEAKRVSQILSRATNVSIKAQGVIAFIAEELDIISGPRDGKVTYISADDIVDWLLRRHKIYNARAVNIIFEKARWSDTWKSH